MPETGKEGGVPEAPRVMTTPEEIIHKERLIAFGSEEEL